MQIKKDTVVAVHYVLTVDGDQIDASQDQALVYLHGHGMMIPGFESSLEGLKAGEKYDFKVAAADGYGTFREELIMDLNKEIFLVDGVMSTQVFEGAQLQLSNQDGHPMVGVVTKITDDHVQMDFNHQLAGKDLHFSGEIESVREATAEEISHGHVHGPGGHHH